jgi:stage II sporulation protein AB (anti-sigma F factor)
MDIINEMKLTLDSRSINEGFSRVAVSAFIACADPNIEEITDIKTAVSEAVTNAIVHGYREKNGKIYITVSIFENNIIRIKIRDKGVGIADINKAMEPLYTTAGEERAGLGFAVMESFMDKVRVTSKPGTGTTVVMEKKIWGKRL